VFCRGLISSSGRPRLGPSSSAHWQLTASSPAEGPAAQGLTFITSLCFTFPFSRTQGLFHPFLPWRRRLGERRRHLSCLRPALCRRRAYPPGMPTPSLSLCCARRSTLNPNKTIRIRIWIQLQYITYYLRFRLHELSGVHVYTHVLCWVRPWCQIVFALVCKLQFSLPGRNRVQRLALRAESAANQDIRNFGCY